MPQMRHVVPLVAGTLAIMHRISNNSPRCMFCESMNYIWRGIYGEACQQMCSNVTKTAEGSCIAPKSDMLDVESESSDSSDDVVVLNHKPADFIDRPPGVRKRRSKDMSQAG
ncbi:hypothetical protein P692DRAFT_20879211 [Suillus brevipes Sb2]|nr:hypothetical protein P692DRAFT_20879211 [Suillus brevipes Sb2]